MDASDQRFPGQGLQPEPVPVADPRLLPTPDYGTLGPNSDIGGGPISIPVRRSESMRRFAPVFAAAIGIVCAVLTANIGNARSKLGSQFGNRHLLATPSGLPATAKDSGQLDR